MNFIYLITYDTLLKNITSTDNILHKENISYILVSNYPKMRYYKIWWWCFLKGILPNDIYLSERLFKTDKYCLRKVIQNIKTDKKLLIVTDNMEYIDSIRDLSNIQYCNFGMFEKYIKETNLTNLQPFN